ncbi:MAG: DUF2920 family protein [bacterium]|nr:DUF2920 family protein [bacterium]MDD3804890.1 DUF2920 family protein [bacterium]MDD4153057.1 DUF2920 family protein [bacterium]
MAIKTNVLKLKNCIIYQNLPKKIKFSFAWTGVLLLALLPVLESEVTAVPQTVQFVKATAGVLAREQEFEAQEWPQKPGKRMVKMWVEEPPAGINKNTGLMLVLHNWGGVYNSSEYIQWCKTFAARFNVIAVSVNYLQSGPEWRKEALPYDHGFLQAMDVIGALYTIRTQLKLQAIEFNENRIYSMGGSGGGNVTQMAMKLAPHTFACGVDICGMPGLIDAIAFGTGEGTNLNAGYSRDPQSPTFLSKDMQEIRDFGHPEHCKILHAANPQLKIVIVHGVADTSCPVSAKILQYRNMLAAGISVDAHFLTEFDMDGVVVKGTGHSVGDREQVVIKYADVYLKEDGAFAKKLNVPNDFARKDKIEYPTSNGRYIVDYSGYPKISFQNK